ncbi:MAG: hypothetical protein JWM16_1664 [Verrucomicrobiales bacterium]|nr:hypothetical protein [Verrucomicrobiales bacterium]
MKRNVTTMEPAAAEMPRRITPFARRRRSDETLINFLPVLCGVADEIMRQDFGPWSLDSIPVAADVRRQAAPQTNHPPIQSSINPLPAAIAENPIRVNWRPLTVRLPTSEVPGSQLPRQFLPMQGTVQNGATLHANFPPGFAARPSALRGEGPNSQASGLPKQAAARLNKASQAFRKIAFASLACKPIRTPGLTAAFSSLFGFGAKHPSRIVGKYRETPSLQNHPNREISGYLEDSREMNQSLFSFGKYGKSLRTTPCYGQIVSSDLHPDLTRNALTYHSKILIQSDRFRPNLSQRVFRPSIRPNLTSQNRMRSQPLPLRRRRGRGAKRHVASRSSTGHRKTGEPLRGSI